MSRSKQLLSTNPEKTSPGLLKIDKAIELENCLIYMAMRKQKTPLLEIARHLGFESITGLQKRVQQWDKLGIIDEARQIFLTPILENYRDAMDELAAELPTIIRKVINTAKTSTKDYVVLESAKWLYEISQSVLAEKKDVGSVESTYAEKMKDDFDPIEISVNQTLFVPKKKRPSRSSAGSPQNSE